jgi:hypothetical protein
MFAVVIVDTMVRSSLPYGGLLPQAFDSLCHRLKTLDTCFYTWMLSGIFDLANFISSQVSFLFILTSFIILEN